MARIGKAQRLRLTAALLFVLAANPTRAFSDDPDELRIPKTGQPTSDFYNAAGTGIRLTAEAIPPELNRGEWLTFKLTITNLVNAPQVEKPSLKALPAFSPFQIKEGSELDSKMDPAVRDRRIFIYELRPDVETVTLIPEIAFYYFDPRRMVAPNRPQDRFPKTFSNAVAIRIRAPSAPTAGTPIPLDVPDFAARISTGNETLTSPSTNPPVWIWLIALVVPPVLAVGWVVAWRRYFPGAAKLVLLKRNRAVRHALQAIARAMKLPTVEAANLVSATVLDYLRERFELPPGAFTPVEIAAHLRSTRCPAERIEEVQSFFRNCDDCRFAPMQRPSDGIALDAERLVIALEESA